MTGMGPGGMNTGMRTGMLNPAMMPEGCVAGRWDSTDQSAAMKTIRKDELYDVFQTSVCYLKVFLEYAFVIRKICKSKPNTKNLGIASKSPARTSSSAPTPEAKQIYFMTPLSSQVDGSHIHYKAAKDLYMGRTFQRRLWTRIFLDSPEMLEHIMSDHVMEISSERLDDPDITTNVAKVRLRFCATISRPMILDKGLDIGPGYDVVLQNGSTLSLSEAGPHFTFFSLAISHPGKPPSKSARRSGQSAETE